MVEMESSFDLRWKISVKGQLERYKKNLKFGTIKINENMNERTYRVLEFDKVKELLREEAASLMTRKVIEELLPSTDEYEIRERMAETTEAVSVIMKKGTLPLGSFYDIEESVNLAQKGGILTIKQMLQILYNLQVSRHGILP